MYVNKNRGTFCLLNHPYIECKRGLGIDSSCRPNSVSTSWRPQLPTLQSISVTIVRLALATSATRAPIQPTNLDFSSIFLTSVTISLTIFNLHLLNYNRVFVTCRHTTLNNTYHTHLAIVLMTLLTNVCVHLNVLLMNVS